MNIVLADQITSFGAFNSIPELIAVELIFALISVPITAIILRKAISMLNDAASDETQKIKIPTLFNAIWISFIVTLSIQVVLILAAIILVPVAMMFFNPEKHSKGLYILMIVSSAILAFFTYSKALSSCWPVNSNTANSIVAIDYMIRFVILLIIGGIAIFLKSLGSA